MKIFLHHTVVIDSRCVQVELEDIDQERLDIDVFGFFLFINSSPQLTLYRHIAAVKATIDRQSPHAKLLCLNRYPTWYKFRRFEAGRRYQATAEMQSPHAKLLSLNISNEAEISSF